MKRLLRWMLALVLVCAGVALAGLGGLGLSVFGTDSTYSSSEATVTASPESLALVADLSGVSADIPLRHVLGDVYVGATGADGRPLFLAQALQSSVDEYLFGTPYDLAVKDGEWTTIPVPGVATELAPPQEQTFWLVSDEGAAPSIPVRLPDSPQSLLIMNADGSPGPSADITLSFVGEKIFTYSLASIIIGVLLVLLAFAVLLTGRRRRKKQKGAAQQGAVVDLSHGGAAEDEGVLAERSASDAATAEGAGEQRSAE